MSEVRLKTAVVGCGNIASTHLGYLSGFGDVEVTALCDVDPTRATALGERFSVSARFSDVAAMLDQARPDVVHVLTPPALAVEIALTAIDRGCHVLMEKPLANSVSDAERLVARAEKAGVRLGVNHSRLRHPAILEAQGLLDSGELGELVLAEIVQGFTRVADSAPRPWSYQYPWGIFDNLMPHCLYYALHFAGSPRDAVVQAHHRGRVPESAFDEMWVELDGARCQARINLTLSTAPERNTVTLRGTRGTVVVDTNLVTVERIRDSSLPSMVAKSMAVADPALQKLRCLASNSLGYALGRMRAYPDIGNSLRAFYDWILGRALPAADGADGLAVVVWMDRIRGLARVHGPATAEEGVRHS